jgi:hypothetical protein
MTMASIYLPSIPFSRDGSTLDRFAAAWVYAEQHMAGATRAWYWHLIDRNPKPKEITINWIQASAAAGLPHSGRTG